MKKINIKKSSHLAFLVLFTASFFASLTVVSPSPARAETVQTDINLYEKYELFLKYEKKAKYSKYKKYAKNKNKYGFSSASAKTKAKAAYDKYKLYKKNPAKYPQYAQYYDLYKKYSKYKKYVTPYSKYSKYKKYKKYDRSAYNEGKNYGGAGYKAGHDRYIAFMADLTNVTTNLGPEIRVGLWSYSVADLQGSPFKITANKSFDVTDCASTVIGAIPIGENVRVTYVTGSGGTLRVYNSNAVPLITETDVPTKICFVATDGDDTDMIFDVNRPSSDNDHYRGKIKIQHSYTTDNQDEEGDLRRIWVINTLPLEHYAWGFGEIGGGVAEHSKTMLVAARTYARWKIENSSMWTEEGFNILSTASAQIYSGYDYEVAHPLVAEAAKATNGIIMKYGEEIVLAAYCSNTDGNTRALEGFPYLVSVPDPYGKVASPSPGNHMWGMSAGGSLVLARDYGWAFTKILAYYYTGINIIKEY